MGPTGRGKQIWIIDEGSPGHVSQSRGLARSLSGDNPENIREIGVRLKLRGIFRPGLKLWLRLRKTLGATVQNLAYDVIDAIPDEAPDLIIASGGKSVPFAVSLSRMTHAPLIYCGPPEPYPYDWFYGILSPIPVPAHPRALQTEALITPMTPESVREPGITLRTEIESSENDLLGAVLIGGSSRSHTYTDADWTDLADGLNELSKKTGIKWLITTSRRTEPKAEELLRSRLLPGTAAKTVWWHNNPDKVVAKYLGAAAYVIVTQDSLSMMSEAVAAAKPVILARPKIVRHSALLDGIIDRVSSEKLVVRAELSQLKTLNYQKYTWNLIEKPLIETYKKTVREWLNW